MHEPPGRTIIVGDVHGCRDELDALLDRVAFASGDRLVFVGDVVARGPDSLGVLDIVRRTGAILVRGNHEQKLLDWRDQAAATAAAHVDTPSRAVTARRATTSPRRRAEPLRLPPTRPPPIEPPPIGRLHRELAATLRPVDWTLLATSPLRVDLESHGATVVHAGVLPGIPLEHQRPEVLLRIRTVRHDLWGTRWQGPPHVVFGHNAAPGLQLHPWATGLDTGCVYGGKLTALVLARGQKIPRFIGARRALLVSEPARRIWWRPDEIAPRLDASSRAT